MFSLPGEIIILILRFVQPRDVQALQCLTRIDLLRLYRYSQNYKLGNKTERRAFEEFHANFFFEHLETRHHVPGLVLRRLLTPNHYMGVSLLQRMHCVGDNEQGVALLAMYRRTALFQRQALPWPTFLALTVYAKHGQLGPLPSLAEEKEMAVAMVKHSHPKHATMVLAAYRPTTPEMVMCMLHFSIPLQPRTLPPSLFTQTLCDYWILRSVPGCLFVANHLPPDFSIQFVLSVNPHLFFSLATKKTIARFHLVAHRMKYTRAYPYFFSALLQYRKRCQLSLRDLVDLSNLHIEQHGTIAYLTTRNKILLRSLLFRPAFETLRRGALAGDVFFKMWVDKLRYISSDEKTELKRVAGAIPHRPNRMYLPYIFSDMPDQGIMPLGNLIAGLAQNPTTYISCGPR